MLVDYANLYITNTDDLTSVIDHIAEKITSHLQKKNQDEWAERSRLHFRLYDGWYEESILTKKAQDIARIIDREYPSENEKLQRIILVELAKAQASRPTFDLLHTFRRRKRLSHLRMCKITNACCEASQGAIEYLKELQTKGVCRRCDHKRPSSELVWYDEQKLVDVMLSMDIAHFAMTDQYSEIAIVSSDDDFIPAMFQTASRGKSIIHINAKAHDRTHNYYRGIAPRETYTELTF